MHVEIINKNARRNKEWDKQRQLYKSILTKQELLALINDEIKLDNEHAINLVEIIDQASFSERPPKNEGDWEKKAEEI